MKLQKRAARLIPKISDIQTPTEFIFQKLGLVPVDYLAKIRNLNVVYRSLNFFATDRLNIMFKYVIEVQTRTRASKKILLYISNRIRLKRRRF